MSIADYSPHASARRFDSGTPPVPALYAGVAGLGVVERRRRAGDREARGVARRPSARRARRARRDRRDAAGAVRPRPARLRPLDRRRARSSRRSPASGSSRRRATTTCASRSISTTSRTTSTALLEALSRRTAHCSRDAGAKHGLPRAVVRRPRPASPTATTPTRSRTFTCPRAEGGPWPCVVLLHGGFWRTGWDRTLMTPLALDLAARGIAAWNVEYRRVGQAGGGWPGTLEDVARCARPARRGRRRRHASRGHVRPLGRRSPRRLARGPPSPRRRGCREPARACGRWRRSRRPASSTSIARTRKGSVAARWQALLGDPAAVPERYRRGLARRARAARRRPAARPRRRGRHRSRDAEPDPCRARPRRAARRARGRRPLRRDRPFAPGVGSRRRAAPVASRG